MNDGQSFPLLGFVPLSFEKPCFLLPVFGNRNQLFIQYVNRHNQIGGFQPCYLTPTTIFIPKSEKKIRYRIGKPRLCAFQFSDGKIVMGSEAKIATALETRLTDLGPYPFLVSEVNEFLKESGGGTQAIKVVEKDVELKRMTQTQLVAEMATKTGVSKKQVKDFMTTLTDLAYREAKKGEFEFPGLGKLVKQKRKARMGRNPATGQEIKIPAKTVLKFRVAKTAKDAVLGTKKR